MVNYLVMGLLTTTEKCVCVCARMCVCVCLCGVCLYIEISISMVVNRWWSTIPQPSTAAQHLKRPVESMEGIDAGDLQHQQINTSARAKREAADTDTSQIFFFQAFRGLCWQNTSRRSPKRRGSRSSGQDPSSLLEQFAVSNGYR